MTLKEKFKQWLDTDPRLQIREVQLEVIAEEFAIGFAEWSDDNYFRIGNTSMWSASLDYEDDVVYQTKELLEIYKKEKGL
jgi:hypothetical protein